MNIHEVKTNARGKSRYSGIVRIPNVDRYRLMKLLFPYFLFFLFFFSPRHGDCQRILPRTYGFRSISGMERCARTRVFNCKGIRTNDDRRLFEIRSTLSISMTLTLMLSSGMFIICCYHYDSFYRYFFT